MSRFFTTLHCSGLRTIWTLNPQRGSGPSNLRIIHTDAQTMSVCVRMALRMVRKSARDVAHPSDQTCRNSRIDTARYVHRSEWTGCCCYGVVEESVVYVLLCVSARVNRIFGMCINFFDCLLSSSPPALHLCL